MTYKEAIYVIADLTKGINSDDSIINEDHIKFLLNKYRATILKKEYTNIKKKVPQSNYQTICLPLEEVNAIDGEPCTGGTYLRSIDAVPHTLEEISASQIYPMDYYQGEITYVSKDKMKYSGYNKYLKNIIYASLGTDNHLYFKSNNPQHKYLEEVQFTGVFEDTDKANELSCNKDTNNCDPLENRFPIEEALFPTLLDLILQEILGASYRPTDSQNNATDDLSDIIAWARRNMKNSLQKQIEGGQ